MHASLAWLNFWPKPEELRKVPLFRANWEGAVAAAERLGYRIEEFVCGGETGFTPQRLKSILEAQGIQGILLPPQRPPVPAGAFDFDWRDFAAVRIGHTVTHPSVHVVTHSQASDTLLACRMIREKGYKRIGHLTSETLDCYAFFEAGFLKSQLASAPEDRIPLLVLENNPEPNERVLKQIDDWMKRHRPDAILSTEGNIVGLLNAAGYRVPEDVAVAASSVRNSDADAGIFENPEEVGRAAVKTLISQLQRHELGIPEFPQDILVHGIWENGRTLPPKT
jgi:DNA-binding LacI/PurR family transcriptional regulator